MPSRRARGKSRTARSRNEERKDIESGPESQGEAVDIEVLQAKSTIERLAKKYLNKSPNASSNSRGIVRDLTVTHHLEAVYDFQPIDDNLLADDEEEERSKENDRQASFKDGELFTPKLLRRQKAKRRNTKKVEPRLEPSGVETNRIVKRSTRTKVTRRAAASNKQSSPKPVSPQVNEGVLQLEDSRLHLASDPETFNLEYELEHTPQKRQTYFRTSSSTLGGLEFKIPRPTMGQSTPGSMIKPSGLPRRDSLYGFNELESPLVLSPVMNDSLESPRKLLKQDSPEELKTSRSSSCGELRGMYHLPIRRPTPKDRDRRKKKIKMNSGEMDQWVKQLNSEFADVDDFELAVD